MPSPASTWIWGPFIAADGYDLTQFNESLVTMYQTEDGLQAGLPFAVFPAAVFYQKELFDEAGLAYPPANYGDKYVMPDGSEVDWNFETLTNIARILTVDGNGADASQDGFDAGQIVQYGFHVPVADPSQLLLGAYLGGAANLVDADNKVTIPESWIAGWTWWHDGMHGDKPFIPNGPIIQSPELVGNAFASGKIAMAVSPSCRDRPASPTPAKPGTCSSCRLMPMVWSTAASMPTPSAF